MKFRFLDSRIPTLFGISIIVVGLSVTTLLVKTQTFTKISAQENNQPQEVRITNITDTSFSVSYKTVAKIEGTLNYGLNSSLGQTAFDENDSPQDLKSRIIHSISVKNLTPQTKYYFSIISGGETYLNNDQNFEVDTAPALPTTENNRLEGKIINPDSTPLSEAIIYITTENSQVVSTLVNKDGTYSLALNNILTSDLSNRFSFSDNSVIKMLVLGENEKSNIILYYSQVGSIPLVTISNNYDFRQENQETATPSANFQDFPSLQSSGSSTKKTGSLKIVSPSKDETPSDQTPVFKGTGVPDQDVQIIIHSDEKIDTSVSSDSSGNWTYTPSAPLSPGTHTITVIAKDAAGILRTITQSFVVFAAENPTPTPLANAQEPTITPTEIPITVTPTVFSSATASALTQSTLPATGNEFIIALGIVGGAISLIGSLLFLHARKN
jgi:LPXTG-motif cell wall-anchored protein